MSSFGDRFIEIQLPQAFQSCSYDQYLCYILLNNKTFDALIVHIGHMYDECNTSWLTDPTAVQQRLLGMWLPMLMVQVWGQMVTIIPLRWWGVRTPWRLSSIRGGEGLVPACYEIAEDVVAVDWKQGNGFRAAWKARYKFSEPFRRLLGRLDGWSGWLRECVGCGFWGGLILLIGDLGVMLWLTFWWF